MPSERVIYKTNKKINTHNANKQKANLYITKPRTKKTTKKTEINKLERSVDVNQMRIGRFSVFAS